MNSEFSKINVKQVLHLPSFTANVGEGEGGIQNKYRNFSEFNNIRMMILDK